LEFLNILEGDILKLLLYFVLLKEYPIEIQTSAFQMTTTLFRLHILLFRG